MPRLASLQGHNPRIMFSQRNGNHAMLFFRRLFDPGLTSNFHTMLLGTAATLMLNDFVMQQLLFRANLAETLYQMFYPQNTMRNWRFCSR